VEESVGQRFDHGVWWLMFITFEGGEGSGKSTQIKLLAERFESLGKRVVSTREPGGTPDGEAVRNLLVTGEAGRWSAEAETLLNYAARDNHLNKIIRPGLLEGKIVLCDRFMDSTRAYQGYAGACTFHLIDELERSIVGATRPDLTFVFDLDPVLGLARAAKQGKGKEDRFERMGLAFHQRLREGFLEIVAQNKDRCRLINAAEPIENVAKAIWKHVNG
jgi:dTMP kinase